MVYLCIELCFPTHTLYLKSVSRIMKYIAAYALCALSGNTPAKADVEAVLKAAGVAVDAARVETLMTEMSGKAFDELVAEGQKKMSSGAAAPAAAAATGAAKPAAKAAAAAKPESSDDDDDMGGLF